MSKKAVQVVHSPKGWKVRTEGATRAVKVASSQALAIERGVSMAKNARTELVVYRTDGSIRSRDTYPDPMVFRKRKRRTVVRA